MSSSVTWKEFSPEELEARSKLYTGAASMMVDLVTSEPYGLAVPAKFKVMADKIKNMEVRPDDVFMITYPKAGSTWTQEMCWQIANGFDVEKGKENIFFRAPFLEISMLCKGEVGATPSMGDDEVANKMGAMMSDSLKFVEDMPTDSPRIIKTHLPLEFLPDNLLEKARVLWVNRNVNDSAVSFYYHEQLLPVHGLKKDSFDEFIQNYMAGKTLYGSYWNHMKSGWSKRDHPNMKIIWYEDMKKDIRSVIRDVAAFFKMDFPDEKVELLADHLAFDNFKNNDAVNMKPPKGHVPDSVRDNFNFIRKGKVGDWKNHFGDDLIPKWNEWVENNNTEKVQFRLE